MEVSPLLLGSPETQLSKWKGGTTRREEEATVGGCLLFCDSCVQGSVCVPRTKAHSTGRDISKSLCLQVYKQARRLTENKKRRVEHLDQEDQEH